MPQHYAEEYDSLDHTDTEYLQSYSADIGVTRVMLGDGARMSFYDAAIRAAGLRGKLVVDVGAGTGILSLMAARAGARKVVAIEASDMALTAARVVQANGYAAVIRVVHARAEDVTLAYLRDRGLLEPNESVDCIVSEWMGFYLLHENMLSSVLHVRDALCCSRLLPARAVVHAAPVDLAPYLAAVSRNFWRDCAGFDLSAVGAIEEAGLLDANPLVVQLPPECLLSEPFTVADLSLDSLKLPHDLAHLAGNGCVSWAESDTARTRGPSAALWGVALWFTVFTDDNQLALRTGPLDPPTHWKQTVVLLPSELRGQIPIAGLVKSRERMNFDIDMTLSDECSRTYDISLSLSDPDA